MYHDKAGLESNTSIMKSINCLGGDEVLLLSCKVKKANAFGLM